MRLTPPAFNNSAITGYQVISSSNGGYSKDCGQQLRCDLDGLTIGAKYEFRVVATNGIGASEPGAPSSSMSADYLPDAVSGIKAVPTNAAPDGGSITISWNPVRDPNPGTAVVGYTVVIAGGNVDEQINVGAGASSLVDTTAGGKLVANERYTVTVFARNSAQASESQWIRSEPIGVTTIGPPSRVTGLAAVGVPARGTIDVSWGAATWNGANGGRYSIGRLPTGTSAPTTCITGGGSGLSDGASDVSSPWVDNDVADGESYFYVVYASNGMYCTPTVSGAIQYKEPPGVASGSASIVAHDLTGQFDIQVTKLDASGTVGKYQYQLNGGGAWKTVIKDQWLTSLGSVVYGSPQSVKFRACREAGNEDYCGPESVATTLTPVNTRVTSVSCQVGKLPLSTGPSNVDATVTYYNSYNDLRGIDGRYPEGLWSGYSTDKFAPEPGLLSNGTGVRVQASVQLVSGAIFRDPGFLQADCTQPVTPPPAA